MSSLKFIFFFFVISFVSLSAEAENLCLEKSDVEEISQHFHQFKELLEDDKKLCFNEFDEEQIDLLKLAHSVITLKNLRVNGQSRRSVSDELQVKAIGKTNWWTYFKERASSFEINPVRCKYSSGSIAYVFGDKRDGIIYLCPIYFKLDILEQVETLLHEVRHFDGHSHVECSHGRFQYRGKQCDTSIQQKGSYAVTIQALVSFSQLKNINHAQKYLLESLVVGRTLNNFNKKLKVKVTDYAYLANKAGEVYRTDVSSLKKIEFVTKLDAPSMVFSNGTHFTLIPLDRSLEASRVDRKFKIPFEMGLYARHYNREDVRERELYSLFDYQGDGLIKDGHFYNSCGAANDKVDLILYGDVKFKSMLNLKVDQDNEISLLIDQNGQGYQQQCDGRSYIYKTTITPTSYKFPADMIGGFSDRVHRLVYLNDGGDVLRFQVDNKKIIPTKIPPLDWVSITPYRVFKFFDDERLSN